MLFGGLALVVVGLLLRRHDPFVDDIEQHRRSAEEGGMWAWAFRLQAVMWEYTWLVMSVGGAAAVVVGLVDVADT